MEIAARSKRPTLLIVLHSAEIVPVSRDKAVGSGAGEPDFHVVCIRYGRLDYFGIWNRLFTRTRVVEEINLYKHLIGMVFLVGFQIPVTCKSLLVLSSVTGASTSGVCFLGLSDL